jgi:hypothetical protein
MDERWILSMSKTISDLIEYNKKVERVKSIILENIIVRIIDEDTGKILWSCHSDEFYNEFKDLKISLEVEQDVNLQTILEEIEKVLD